MAQLPTLVLKAGDWVDIELPSGKVINVEVTSDTASAGLCGTGQVLFSEELDHNPHQWKQTYPESL